MLFTGDGEAFNVCLGSKRGAGALLMSVGSLGSSLKMYRRTPGQIWALHYALGSQ